MLVHDQLTQVRMTYQGHELLLFDSADGLMVDRRVDFLVDSGVMTTILGPGCSQ